MLGLNTKKSSLVDNQLLRALPRGEGIGRTVMGFPKGKALGGDGITYDFLKEC